MDELDRAVQNAQRMRQARKRLNELKENIAVWAGGGLLIDGGHAENHSESESITYDGLTDDRVLIDRK